MPNGGDSSGAPNPIRAVYAASDYAYLYLRLDLDTSAGIDWGRSVAEKHKWGFVKTGFEKVVAPRPKAMAYIVVFSELAIGLGLVLGFLTPIALVGAILLNLLYFILMIHDWAEQGQNSMMLLAEVVCLGTHAWATWSVDDALGLF